jgi:hypothetical protein
VLIISLVGVLACATLIWQTWPRPADAQVLQAYTDLEHATVPVKVLGWIDPSEPSLQLTTSGYAFSVRDPHLGSITISAQRAAVPVIAAATSGPSTRIWQEGDVLYALTTSGDPALAEPRVIPLADARRQLVGNGADTWLLYGLYLPGAALFAGWALWSGRVLRRAH